MQLVRDPVRPRLILRQCSSRPQRVSLHVVRRFARCLEKFCRSPVVLEEMAHGDPDAAQRRLHSTASFPVLELVPEVHTLAAAYFAAIPLPDKAQADAYHLALAAWVWARLSCTMEWYARRQRPSPHDH